MVRVQRYNVILDIDDEELPKYMNLGYNQIDAVTGKVINEAIPTDANVLRCAYQEHIKEIAELKAEIEKLKAKPKKTTKE